MQTLQPQHYLSSDHKSLSQSVFILKRSDNSSTRNSIEVNFSPISLNNEQINLNLNGYPKSNQSLDIQNQQLKSYPIFNQDKKFYTPCFILQVDKMRYIENQNIYHALHQKKKEEMAEEKFEILVPKPAKNCSYCCICKIIFNDYLTHVTNPYHMKILRNSQFTTEIHKLCEKVNQNNQEISISNQCKTKQKKIRKNKQKVQQQKPVIKRAYNKKAQKK